MLLVAADDSFDSSNLLHVASQPPSSPTQQAHSTTQKIFVVAVCAHIISYLLLLVPLYSTMALTGQAPQAILTANSEANRQAMTTISDTLAAPLNQKSAEDQAIKKTKIATKMQHFVVHNPHDRGKLTSARDWSPSAQVFFF